MKNLLKKAKKAPQTSKASKHKWIKLCPVILLLREEKGYTHKEVSEWLTAEGYPCKSADISQAIKRYMPELVERRK